LPLTTGAERPPYGARHKKFSPFMAHFSTSPVSFEVPSLFGPRISGQSPIAMRRGPWADALNAKMRKRAVTTTGRVLDIELPGTGGN
jgi:hypothetical protein